MHYICCVVERLKKRSKIPHFTCLPFLIFACNLYSCSSGEYEIEEHNVETVEKTVKIDTIRKLADTTNLVKEEFKPAKYTYVVQIGAYYVQSNFEKFFARAREVLGAEVYETYVNDLHKIRLGKFSDKSEALKLLDRVKSLGYSDAFVITSKQ